MIIRMRLKKEFDNLIFIGLLLVRMLFYGEKMLKKECNIEKGIDGEELVKKVIMKASATMGKHVKVFNHVILDFDSVYGRRTAELDHIIVTDNKIIIGETKNGFYKGTEYEKLPWTHLDGSQTDNPVVQNHYHKKIFCSLFNIQREKVVTVEFLLKYSKCKVRTQYANDYVLGIDNLFNGICLLISDDSGKSNFKQLCNQLKEIEKKSIGREQEHINNLIEIREIEEKTRTRDNHYKFKRTDVVLCPRCGANLVFRYKKWKKYKIGNKKKTKNIALGCSNFAITKCNSFIEPLKDGGGGFDNIQPIRIEDRMGWTMEEQHKKTILDEYISLKKENAELVTMLNAEKEKNKCNDDQIDNLNKINNHLIVDKKNAINRAEMAEFENRRYKKLIGKIYIKK